MLHARSIWKSICFSLRWWYLKKQRNECLTTTEDAMRWLVCGRMVEVPNLWSEGCGFEAWLLGFLDNLLTRTRESLFMKQYNLVPTGLGDNKHVAGPKAATPSVADYWLNKHSAVRCLGRAGRLGESVWKMTWIAWVAVWMGDIQG